MINVKTITIIICDVTFSPFDIPKIRGFFSNRYKKFELVHNHLKDSQQKYRYAYPAIQFKIIDSHPALIGIGDGIHILKEIFLDVDHMNIDNKIYNINEKMIAFNQVKFGQVDYPIKYKFLLPWMALNQNNYEHYLTLGWSDKRTFLENILRGNLKSISHGFDYWIPDFDKLKVVTHLKEIARNFKNIQMICFQGPFETNFEIPNYLGIGKQTARGFGTVIRVDNE